MGDTKKADRCKSLCALAILNKQVTVFEDALKESCLLANPNVIGDFGLRFYAGAPIITHDGFMIGTLCIIDKKPRTFTDQEKTILEGLAQTAMDQIELRRSALDTIEQVQSVNNELISAQEDLQKAVENLAEFSIEMEATNRILNTTNSELNQSYDLTVSLNQNLRHSEQRLQSFITKAPIAFGILTGRDLFIEVANEMILKIWGKTSSVIGQPLALALPELQGQPYLSLLDNVFMSGKTYIGDTAPVRLELDGVLSDCYFDFI